MHVILYCNIDRNTFFAYCALMKRLPDTDVGIFIQNRDAIILICRKITKEFMHERNVFSSSTELTAVMGQCCENLSAMLRGFYKSR